MYAGGAIGSKGDTGHAQLCLTLDRRVFRSRLCIALTVWALWCTAILGRAAAQEGPGNRWAVIVGVGEYEFPYGNLTAANDAQVLHTLLTSGAHAIPGRQARLLSTSATDPSLRPTRDNILAVLKEVTSQLGTNDVFLFFFAGHGVVQDDRLLLIAVDTHGGEGTEALSKSALPYRSVKELIDSSQARAKLTFMDACHSGIGRSVNRMDTSMARSLAPRSAANIVMASCSPDEQSWEYDKAPHGAYTWYLLEGLGGAADREEGGNGDGAVSVNELWRYVQVNVSKWAAALAKRQTPQMLTARSGFSDFNVTLAPVAIPSLPEPGHSIVAVSGGDWPHFVTALTVPRNFELGPTEAMMSSETVDQVRQTLLAQIPKSEAELVPFELSATLVTNEQYAAFVADSGHTPPANGEGWDEGQLRPGAARTLPVTMISYEDAEAYCGWLSRAIGQQVRMPMIHEWQFAARAGDDGALYPWGAVWPPTDEMLAAANRLGLYQMPSEYSEWCFPKIGAKAIVAKDFEAEAWFRRSTVSSRVVETTCRHPSIGFRVLIEK